MDINGFSIHDATTTMSLKRRWSGRSSSPSVMNAFCFTFTSTWLLFRLTCVSKCWGFLPVVNHVVRTSWDHKLRTVQREGIILPDRGCPGQVDIESGLVISPLLIVRQTSWRFCESLRLAIQSRIVRRCSVLVPSALTKILSTPATSNQKKRRRGKKVKWKLRHQRAFNLWQGAP